MKENQPHNFIAQFHFLNYLLRYNLYTMNLGAAQFSESWQIICLCNYNHSEDTGHCITPESAPVPLCSQSSPQVTMDQLSLQISFNFSRMPYKQNKKVYSVSGFLHSAQWFCRFILVAYISCFFFIAEFSSIVLMEHSLFTLSLLIFGFQVFVIMDKELKNIYMQFSVDIDFHFS